MAEIQAYTLAELMALNPPRQYPAEPTTPVTFADLDKIDPLLGVLLREAKAAHTLVNPKFCANEIWYGYGGYPGIKPRLRQLVGWERSDMHPLLATRTAYDVAYDMIYGALPDCRNCGCPIL